ncbi:MAG: PqqD family protein [Lachnospiraceae bacterium]|nr:PqqD family protein [Lachnospiraceae bacterium]
MNKSNRFQGFLLRKIPGCNYILDLRTPGDGYKKPLKINDTAAYIYEMLDSWRSVEDIAGDISEETGESLRIIEEDINAFLEEIRSFGVNV